MRKVIVSHMVLCDTDQMAGPGLPVRRYELRQKGEAIFHQFGVGYEELDAGTGNYTTAVVEWPDGQVESVLAERIRFVVPLEASQ